MRIYARLAYMHVYIVQLHSFPLLMSAHGDSHPPAPLFEHRSMIKMQVFIGLPGFMMSFASMCRWNMQEE